MTELKPCPFCGTIKPHLMGGAHILDDGGDYWYVCCRECGASTTGNQKREKAIKAWNRRVNDATD